MAEKTGITWTGSTWNPWYGCEKVSQGCKLCYAEREFEKRGQNFRLVTRSKTKFNDPLKWARNKTILDNSMIFTCSLSDWFIPAADEWRDEAWDIIRNTPYIYQILTKRPENIISRLPKDWGEGWPNVWLGVSVESQEYLKRAEILADIPAALRFISYEPALGRIDFTPILKSYRWLISGGESGYNPRPSYEDWFEYTREQCRRFGVAYFHKQNGGNHMIDGAWGGKTLKGRIYQAFPEFKVSRETKDNQPALF